MFDICIADLRIRIDNKFEFVKRMCRDYIVLEEEDADLFVFATVEEIDKERSASLKVNKKVYQEDYIESICIYRRLCRKLPSYDAFLFHSAVVEIDGNGYVIAARSGTGKTTHAELWCRYLGAEFVNGDKPILRFLGSENRQLYACGTPWKGKEQYGADRIVPIKACLFLKRSEENCISPLLPKDAVTLAMQQILIMDEEEMMLKMMGLLDEMLLRVPCYLLECNISEEAARMAYSFVKEDRKVEN